MGGDPRLGGGDCAATAFGGIASLDRLTQCMTPLPFRLGSSTLKTMERICTHCHAVLAHETKADWCPACGGALSERPSLPDTGRQAKPEVDHRGIVLPRRHALGGIISPT